MVNFGLYEFASSRSPFWEELVIKTPRTWRWPSLIVLDKAYCYYSGTSH